MLTSKRGLREPLLLAGGNPRAGPPPFPLSHPGVKESLVGSNFTGSAIVWVYLPRFAFFYDYLDSLCPFEPTETGLGILSELKEKRRRSVELLLISQRSGAKSGGSRLGRVRIRVGIQKVQLVAVL